MFDPQSMVSLLGCELRLIGVLRAYIRSIQVRSLQVAKLFYRQLILFSHPYLIFLGSVGVSGNLGLLR